MQFPQILDMEQGMISNQDKFEHQQQQQQPPPQPRRVIRPPEGQNHHQPPPPQKCPRCDSTNTKFCYYNNYSLSQPRYFCKACRRYWTHGGTLRNVPVGGGCRKSKRPRTSSSSSADTARSQQPVIPPGQGLRGLAPVMNPPPAGNSFYSGGAFMSSLAGLQPLTSGFNQGPGPGSLNLGVGGSQFGANMALLQGMNVPPVIRPHQAPQPQLIQGQNDMFASHQGLFPQRPMSSWTQNFVNRSTGSTAMSSSSSAPNPGFWTGYNTPDGNNQAVGSSYAPNQWSDSNNNNNNNNQAGFDPSQ